MKLVCNMGTQDQQALPFSGDVLSAMGLFARIGAAHGPLLNHAEFLSVSSFILVMKEYFSKYLLQRISSAQTPSIVPRNKHTCDTCVLWK